MKTSQEVECCCNVVAFGELSGERKAMRRRRLLADEHHLGRDLILEVSLVISPTLNHNNKM